MISRNLSNDVIGYARSLAEPRQVKLLNFSSAAHIVHQVVGVALAPNKSHNHLLCTSVAFVV